MSMIMMMMMSIFDKNRKNEHPFVFKV